MKEVQIEEVTVKLFPSPATDVLKVSLHAFDSRDVQVSLFDVTGNVVKNGINPVIDNGLSGNVQNVPPSLRLLQSSGADRKSFTKKSVIT